MFDRKAFNTAMIENACARLFLSTEALERLRAVTGELSNEDQERLDANRSYYETLAANAKALAEEINEAEATGDAVGELSIPARALYEALYADDRAAFELAPLLSEREADAVIYCVALSDDTAWEWERMVTFAFDFAEESSTPAMREELVRIALAEGIDDDAEGRNFAKMEALLGRPLAREEIDEYLLLFMTPADLVPFLKEFFRRGGSDFYLRIAAQLLLDWDEEEEAASFEELVALLPAAEE